MSKVIVITGAGVGLGRALARRFAKDGDKVVLLGRTFSKVEAVAAELGGSALAIECDVSSAASVRTAFATIAATHPKIDVLINNAAVYEPFLVMNATDEQIHTAIGTNLAGLIYCVRSAIPMLNKGGHILNLTSESVDLSFPHLSLYQTTKAGVERFSAALAIELEPMDLRVTVVQAGQMMEEGKVWGANPADIMAFAQAAAAAGINLRERPITQFSSVTDVFRALIDLPADLTSTVVKLRARKAH